MFLGRKGVSLSKGLMKKETKGLFKFLKVYDFYWVKIDLLNL